jgi:hypothetical protein
MKKPSAKFEYKTFSLGEQLTEEQKEYFKKYGVIHFKKFIDSKTAEIFISEDSKTSLMVNFVAKDACLKINI